MKNKALYFTLMITILGLTACKKSSSTDPTVNLSQTESQLKSDYQQAQNYNNILVDRFKTPGMTLNDSICKMNDSLFHMNDTSFTIHMREFCTEMMSDMGMGSNGMMGGGMMGGGTSGGMMCNMDSVIMSMNGMMNMTTFKMDSMMEDHMKNCPKMGTLNTNVQGYLDNMQAMRKSHRMFHK